MARRIAVQSGLSADPAAFTVTILNSPIDNAFAIPGGYVYITRGLLSLVNDEAELAAVLGHEVGHVAARHSKRRQNVATRNAVLGVLGQLAVGALTRNSGMGQLLGRGIGTGTQLLTLGYSRGQETEADNLGVRYLVGAKYDSDALASMLGELAQQTALVQQIAGRTQSVPAWASTHPEPEKRVANALAQARTAGGTDLPRNRAAYLAAVDGLLYGDDPKQGLIDGQQFSHPDLRISFTAPVGFTLSNGARAVTITGQGAKAEFSTLPYSGDLTSYVRQVQQALAGSNAAPPPSGPINTGTANGLPSASTTLSANSENGQALDVTIVAFATSATQAFHFTVITPAGQGLGPLAPLVQSFRTLTPAQAAAIKPRYLRVVTVKPGETTATFAARMAFDSFKMERFLTLNGLAVGATLQPGNRVKIVTY